MEHVEPAATFSSLVRDAVSQLHTRFFTLVFILVLPGILTLYSDQFLSLVQSVLTKFPDSPATVVVVAAFIWFVLNFFVTSWGMLALIISLAHETSLINSYTQALSRLPKFILLNLLVFISVSGGYLLLIIPGFILSLRLSLSAYIFGNEGLGGWGALERSRFYTQGNLLKILMRTLGASLLVMLLTMPVQFVINSAPDWAAKLLGVLVNAVGGAFVATFLFLLYKSLKAGREQEQASKLPFKWVYFTLGVVGLVLLVGLLYLYFVSLVP